MTDNKTPIIDTQMCTGCTICIEECPVSALEMKDDISILSKPDDCTGCEACEEICPVSAISME
ncbi:ATP-binding protein [Elusimicrobiota bacterium]